MERRLAAIMATDVVGYSRLMTEDEEATLAQLKAHRAEFFDPKIAEYRGRVIKLMGDGALVEFASVVDAVNCAIAIQSTLAESAGGLRLRIGVNLGDVIVEGEDIYGDGVNIAARLEALAEPGGICISAVVRESLGPRIRTTFADAGAQAVKNIDRPIHIFRWPAGEDADEVPFKPRAKKSGKPGIAVLPFNNMSGDPDQEGFVDGLTEDIITALSRGRWYDVTARNSTFAYKGSSRDLREVGKALGVDYRLGGSVRKGVSSLRITAQLIDAESGNHVWADRFDRSLDDEFAIQDEIAQRVSSILGERIWQDIARNIGQKQEKDYTAYDYAFSAIALIHWLDPEDLDLAKERLLKALSTEPDIPACHLGLGFCYLIEGLYLGDPEGMAIEQAHGHALTLLEMAPDDPQTYRLLSRTYWAKGLPAEAWQSVERALRLNPNDGDIIANRGVYHLFKGEFEEAQRWIDRVLELHAETPHTVDIMHHWKAMAAFGLKDDEGALAQLGQISGLEFLKRLFLACCHARLGNQAQASADMGAVLKMRPALRLSNLGFWKLFQREQDRALFHDALKTAGLPE